MSFFAITSPSEMVFSTSAANALGELCPSTSSSAVGANLEPNCLRTDVSRSSISCSAFGLSLKAKAIAVAESIRLPVLCASLKSSSSMVNPFWKSLVTGISEHNRLGLTAH